MFKTLLELLVYGVILAWAGINISNMPKNLESVGVVLILIGSFMVISSIFLSAYWAIYGKDELEKILKKLGQ